MESSKKASSQKMKLLELSYYQSNDVVAIAKDLLGKILLTKISGKITSGEIVETEAYNGVHDKACHAYGKRITKRTSVMYQKGGSSYVYLCYGIHHLFNVVTGKEDNPCAVLIRAIKPLEGISTMLERRKKKHLTRSVTAGPGALCQALGINKDLNNILLTSDIIRIYDDYNRYLDENIIVSERVNIEYAKEDAKLPYRFRVKKSPWTSIAK